jgi:hypothetical protein
MDVTMAFAALIISLHNMGWQQYALCNQFLMPMRLVHENFQNLGEGSKKYIEG